MELHSNCACPWTRLLVSDMAMKNIATQSKPMPLWTRGTRQCRSAEHRTAATMAAQPDQG